MASDFNVPVQPVGSLPTLTSSQAGKGGKLTAVEVDVGSDYGKAITEEVDKAIRHMPGVLTYIEKMAQRLADNTGSDHFRVFLATAGEERPRAYVIPDDEGIHLEKTQSILLKMAVSMEGDALPGARGPGL